MNNFMVFDAGAHPEIVQDACTILTEEMKPKETEEEAGPEKIEPGRLELLRFSNGNIANKIIDDVRDCDPFLISTQHPPVQENVQMTLSVSRNLRKRSEGKVRVIWLYMPGSRSDKVDQLRISLGAKDMADQIVDAGAHGVVIFDPHFPQIVGFFDSNRTRVEIVTAKSIFLNLIVTEYSHLLNNLAIVSPDLGAAKLAGSFATRLGPEIDLVFVDKRRIGNEEKVRPVAIIGNVKGKDCIVPDDEFCGGGTFIEVALFLLKNGARSVMGMMTHGVITNLNALEKIDSIPEITALHVTNTIPVPADKRKVSSKLKVHSVAHIVAGVIRCIHERKSIHGPNGFLRNLYLPEVRK